MPYADPEKARQHRKEYYQRNKSRILQQTKQWALDHPEKRKEIWTRFNKKKSTNEYKLKWWEKKYFERNIDRKRCEVCERTKMLVVHHKDLNNKNNDPSNHQVLCRSCHARIHGKIRGGINK